MKKNRTEKKGSRRRRRITRTRRTRKIFLFVWFLNVLVNY